MLQQLANMGLNDTAYQQFASQGTESLAAAQALVQSGAAGIAQVNALQSQINAYATQAGNAAASYLYSAGIASARGVVDGLQREQDRLNRTMDNLGARLANAIADAVNDTKLGLKTTTEKTTIVRAKKKKKKETPKRKHAAGTLATLGGSFLAGETGAELVRAPARSRVYSARETANLAAGSSPQRDNTKIDVHNNYYGPTTGGGRLRELEWTLKYATTAPGSGTEDN